MKTICTKQFEIEVGKKPKGSGSWLFEDEKGRQVYCYGSFKAASREAVQRLRGAKKIQLTKPKYANN